MAIFRTQIKSNSNIERNGGKTIYRLQIGDKSYYFGSLSAIYDVFTPEYLKVSLSRLYTFKITYERPYRNKVCMIYKGEIHRKKGNRKGGN